MLSGEPCEGEPHARFGEGPLETRSSALGCCAPAAYSTSTASRPISWAWRPPPIGLPDRKPKKPSTPLIPPPPSCSTATGSIASTPIGTRASKSPTCRPPAGPQARRAYRRAAGVLASLYPARSSTPPGAAYAPDRPLIPALNSGTLPEKKGPVLTTKQKENASSRLISGQSNSSRQHLPKLASFPAAISAAEPHTRFAARQTLRYAVFCEAVSGPAGAIPCRRRVHYVARSVL